MTNEERELCEELSRVAPLRSEPDIDRYVELVRALSASTAPDVLRCLLRALYDADAGEAQYELVEAAEAFPDQVYVPALLEALPAIREQAPRWGRLLLQSALNTPATRVHIEALVPALQGEQRTSFLAVIREIADDDPRYEEMATTLGS